MANSRKAPPRRGWSSLWLVIWLPALLVLFSALLGIANLWLARVELENAMEAAALAAVKEWGDRGGGETFVPRCVGVEFAAANLVRGEPVHINSNYGHHGCNQNLACGVEDGNLIFGALDESNSDHVVFDAGKCPSCGAGSVLFDATGSGNGSLSLENAWGISFHNSPNLPDDIRIERIIIDLRGSGGDGVFTGSVVLDEADPSEGWAMRDQSGPLQPDIRGFADLSQQTEFSNLGNGKLQIDFSANDDDGGFEPGDRFRFGYDVDDVSSGNGHDDSDGIGRDGTTVTIFFSIGGNDLPPVMGKFVDNTETARAMPLTLLSSTPRPIAMQSRQRTIPFRICRRRPHRPRSTTGSPTCSSRRERRRSSRSALRSCCRFARSAASFSATSPTTTCRPRRRPSMIA